MQVVTKLDIISHQSIIKSLCLNLYASGHVKTCNKKIVLNKKQLICWHLLADYRNEGYNNSIVNYFIISQDSVKMQITWKGRAYYEKIELKRTDWH